MRLGVINFSEKHANIGTVVWATVWHQQETDCLHPLIHDQGIHPYLSLHLPPECHLWNLIYPKNVRWLHHEVQHYSTFKHHSITRNTISWLSTKCMQKNAKNNLYSPERSICPTPHKPLPSSSSRRKMEDSIPAKTTTMSTNIPSATPISFPLFLILLTNYEMPRSSPSLMFTGGTTMYKSKMATNGRPPLSPTRDYLNPQSYSLDLPTPPLLSNDSWTTPSETWLLKDGLSSTWMTSSSIPPHLPPWGTHQTYPTMHDWVRPSPKTRKMQVQHQWSRIPQDDCQTRATSHGPC